MSYELPRADDAAHADLFETISEAHYLPELSGPHDEALLESLVEKGCEDNQILGQALDKLAHLVHGAATGEYGEEEEDILLSDAPVADIIERLEQSLESPGRSSMSAAQGLLHLHHIGDRAAHAALEQSYIGDDVYLPVTEHQTTHSTHSALDTLADSAHLQSLPEHVPEIEHRSETETEPQLKPELAPADITFTELPPDNECTYQNLDDHNCPNQTILDQSEADLVTEIEANKIKEEIEDETMEKSDSSPKNALECENLAAEVAALDFEKGADSPGAVELVATDLSTKNAKNVKNTKLSVVVEEAVTVTTKEEDNVSEKSDEQPRDLSVGRRSSTPHASPRRLELPRAPSRESDAMQSPQPSGIPAVPSSPELFTVPQTKSKQTLFLETLLSSPSPKMYTSEVTITKQQCEPLNLGKHRKSASPTVSSCTDDIRKTNKDFGEPQEKRSRRESTEELAKISKVFTKSSSEDRSLDYNKNKKPEKQTPKPSDENSPLKQYLTLKNNPDFSLPDPLLVPKAKLNDIVSAPGREIPALLIQRPELRLPEAFRHPLVLQDPDILVVSLRQLEDILENGPKGDKHTDLPRISESKQSKSNHNHSQTKSTEQASKPDQTVQSKSASAMDGLAGDIDAASAAAINQMLWLPYLNQLEAAMSSCQNMDFLKALNTGGYPGANYADLSQMMNSPSRYMGQAGFPMMPPMDYDNRNMQFAMWQEAMNQSNAAALQRSKSNAATSTMKDLSKSNDLQNPYIHSTKNSQSKSHTSARTSPIAHNYNTACQRGSMSHNPFLQGTYPGMNPNVRHNVPLPGLQIPYFNPMMASQRSPRSQQKSPTSPYYNNNYLQSVKQHESQAAAREQRSCSTSSQESPRPRISVKSLQNLLDPAAAAAASASSSGRRHSSSSMGSNSGRRREEPEVGSTTPGEPVMPVMPHPHDPIHQLWHPLFGNQKGYNHPWSWTTVTATGD